jgi:outer membrane protein assembly factor BamD
MRGTAAVLAGSLLLVACAGKSPQPPPEKLWQEANEAYDDEAYQLAVERYKQFLDQYPFDENAEEAELRIARSYYLAARFPEAIAAFENFERMHPTSKNLPAVEYHQGMSYAMQHGDAERDQRFAQSALTSFRNVIDRFPYGRWADKSKLRIRECREALARHESAVADFYLGRKSLRAAESRLTGLLTEYPETDATAEALIHFAESYDGRGEEHAADLAFATIARHRPDSPQATTAIERLGAKNPLVTGPDPLPQLLAWIDEAQTDESRLDVPRTVSAFPDRAGTARPGN